MVVLGRALEGRGRRKAGAMGSTRARRRRDRQVVVEASGGDVCWSLLLCGAAGAWQGMVMTVGCVCEAMGEWDGWRMNEGHTKARPTTTTKKMQGAAREKKKSHAMGRGWP